MTSAGTAASRKSGSAGGPDKEKIGLVLQGGGALGAYEAGAVRCLYDRGMECTIVAGASSGALNAVTLAAAKANPPDALEAMWKGFGTPELVPHPIEHLSSLVAVPHMYGPRLDYWRLPAWTSLADNTPLRETLERLDWDQVRDPDHMRVFVSASDLDTGETVYFSNLPPDKLPKEPEYPPVRFGVEHVLASGSFPGGFPWTEIEGKRYWDGGVTDNTPLHPVIDNLKDAAEAETLPIYVIDVNTGAGPRPANLLQVQLRFFEMLLQNNLKTDTHRAESYTRFIGLLKRVDEIMRTVPENPPPGALADLLALKSQPDWGKAMTYDPVRNVHVVDIKKPAGESPADFDSETIEHRLRAGYEQMCEYLGNLQQQILGCACRKPMPPGDIHGSRLRRGLAAGGGSGPGQ
jgi:NTE family protein